MSTTTVPRHLQMIGATTEASSDAHAWFFGANHDYYLELPNGKVVAEVNIQPSRFQDRNDTIWCVTWVEFLRPGPVDKDTPMQEYYVTRSAARQAIEDRYAMMQKQHRPN